MEESSANPELSHEIVNDIPVLMHLLGERLGVGQALDEIVERHGNRLGLSVGGSDGDMALVIQIRVRVSSTRALPAALFVVAAGVGPMQALGQGLLDVMQNKNLVTKTWGNQEFFNAVTRITCISHDVYCTIGAQWNVHRSFSMRCILYRVSRSLWQA